MTADIGAKKLAEATISMFSLSDLETIIASRASAEDGSSYTATLVGRGTAHCAQKLGEEAVETVIAAMSGDRDKLKYESADLLYHLLVLLKVSDLPLSQVLAELESRTAQSGLAEKASRTGTGKSG